MTRLTGAAKASHERKILLDAARRAITRRDTDSVLIHPRATHRRRERGPMSQHRCRMCGAILDRDGSCSCGWDDREDES